MWLPRALALACAVSLPPAALAGCDSDSVHRAHGGTLAIELSEYRIEPQTARLAPGRITLELRNTGRLAHNLVLERNGREVLKVPTMLPERSGPNVVRVPVTLRGGDYRMLCTVSNHEDLGQDGTLQVRRP